MRFTENDWQVLVEVFTPPTADAAAERKQIAMAIAIMEDVAGERAGIDGDRGRNRWGGRMKHQLDCRAESVNSTSFLLAMQERKLLTWHEVSSPAYRGLLKGMLPHNTAVIIEKNTGAEFVVDSWFFDNGIPPVIVPLESWLAGYDPEKTGEKRRNDK